MKTQTKQIVGFTSEIIFFVYTGILIANKEYWYALISVIFASLFAGYTGQLIKQQVLEEEYK